MDILEIREFALTLPEVGESMPFGEDVLIFKVEGKIFLALWLGSQEGRIALKCDPERAIQLRDLHPEVTPAWHFNKRHWNDISLMGDLSAEMIREEIRHAWLCTVRHNVTPKARREALLQLWSEAEGA